jgi:hypothetical protein
MADLVESLVAAVFVDSGGDWGKTWAAAEYLLWREGVVQLPAVQMPEDPAAAAAAALVAKMAAAEQAAAAAAAEQQQQQVAAFAAGATAAATAAAAVEGHLTD